MTNYLDILSDSIQDNWYQSALTDFYLNEDGSAQDTSRGNHYTYGEMYIEIVRVANYLSQIGLKRGDHIAICGANSAHWVIAYLAIAKMQGVSVTIMHSLMPEQISELVHFSNAKALFTDEDIWKELRDLFIPQVHTVVSLADWSCLRSEMGVIICEPQPLVHQMVSFPICAADTLAMLCFTTGTEGMPKGVMLSYRNISNVTLNELNGFPKTTNVNYVSLLPYAHTYGLMTDIIGQLSFKKHIHIIHSVSSKTLFLALHWIKPYAIVTIPNTLEQMYVRFKEQLPMKLGGECEQLYIGGASLSQETTNALLSLGLPFSMGYGMSETCFLISYVQSTQYRFNSAGKISIGMTARIADNGEILVKGENVMLGYYKNPEATAKKIDKDGWLHTGDKGYLDEDGYLYVEGRLEQDMIVLPDGENIHPDNIECKINALPDVTESIVIARDGKLIAIVIPNKEIAIEDRKTLRLSILKSVNAQLPFYAQLYDIEWSEEPLARTAKQTIKRYLYK